MASELDETGSDDMLAPLPNLSTGNNNSNSAAGNQAAAGTAAAAAGRRLSRAPVGGRAQARGRLATLTGPGLGLDFGPGGGGMRGGGAGAGGPVLLLENTYRMRPEESARFNCRLAKEVLRAALESAVAGVGQKYDPTRCRAACQVAADQVRRELREQDSRRYKLVVSVHAVQLLGQTAVVASRSVGSSETDSWVSAQVAGGEFACVATAHALYYE